MADQMLVTCFTDLEDSTRLNQILGQTKYFEFLNNHFSVTKALTRLTGGDYVKNTGDGNMVLFASGEQAIRFASRLQEFYAEQPCRTSLPLKFRIGLSLGQVERTESDAHGPGANRAARVLSKAKARQIIIDKTIVESLKNQWGVEEYEKYVIFFGNHELKGFSDPATHELFSFEWQRYRNDCPDYSLVKLVFEHLYQGKVEASYLSIKELSNSGVIIWPIVPRGVVNAIHRG